MFVTYRIVDFGDPAKAGLTTVGYTLEGGTRVSTGIEDLGDGRYGAHIAIPDAGYSGPITWDTGGSTPQFLIGAINCPPPADAPSGATVADAVAMRLLAQPQYPLPNTAAGLPASNMVTVDAGAIATATAGKLLAAPDRPLANHATSGAIAIDLTQPLDEAHAKQPIVGGALTGQFCAAWGNVIKDRVAKVLKIFGWTQQTTPLATFTLDDGDNPAQRTLQ